MRLFHGLFSLALVGAALATGFAAGVDPLAYGLVTAAGCVLIFGAYCAKCPCRLSACAHVLPGLVTRILPRRRAGTYRWYDFTGLVIGGLAVFAFPQPALVRQPELLALFWGLVALAVVEISLFLCRGCANGNCPLCRGQSGR